jgi:hypothetical protein
LTYIRADFRQSVDHFQISLLNLTPPPPQKKEAWLVHHQKLLLPLLFSRVYSQTDIVIRRGIIVPTLRNTQAASAGAGGSRNEHLDAELRRYKADVERLDNELRRQTIRAEELASELSALRQSTVSVGRERDLEAKVDRIQREADNNYKKLQVIN